MSQPSTGLVHLILEQLCRIVPQVLDYGIAQDLLTDRQYCSGTEKNKAKTHQQTVQVGFLPLQSLLIHLTLLSKK